MKKILLILLSLLLIVGCSKSKDVNTTPNQKTTSSQSSPPSKPKYSYSHSSIKDVVITNQDGTWDFKAYPKCDKCGKHWENLEGRFSNDSGKKELRTQGKRCFDCDSWMEPTIITNKIRIN